MGCDHSKPKAKPAVKQTEQPPPEATANPAVVTEYRGAKLFKRTDFTVEDFIQEGGQGKVFVGRHIETEKLFALKVRVLHLLIISCVVVMS